MQMWSLAQLSECQSQNKYQGPNKPDQKGVTMDFINNRWVQVALLFALSFLLREDLIVLLAAIAIFIPAVRDFLRLDHLSTLLGSGGMKAPDPKPEPKPRPTQEAQPASVSSESESSDSAGSDPIATSPATVAMQMSETTDNPFVIGILPSFLYSAIEDDLTDEDYPTMRPEICAKAFEKAHEFLNEFLYRFDSAGPFADYLIADQDETDFYSLEDGIKNGKIKDISSAIMYFYLTEPMDEYEVNDYFLAMDEYGFYAYFKNSNDQLITQGYDFGEYDTGFFAADDFGHDVGDYIDKSHQPAAGMEAAAAKFSGR